MKLDPMIIEGKKPLTCFDVEEAKEFIGKQCYFSDNAIDFMDLDKADGDSSFYIAELQNIWTAEEYCFADNSNDYRFILPCEWVQSTEEQEQFAHDSLELALLIDEYLIHHTHPSEIMKQHAHERNNFLRDVFERILSGDK